MASRDANARRRHAVVTRLLSLADKVSSDGARRIEEAGRRGRDPEYRLNEQLEALADVLEEAIQDNVMRDEGDLTSIKGIDEATAQTLKDAGYETKADLRDADDEELLAISGIGPGTLHKIRKAR